MVIVHVQIKYLTKHNLVNVKHVKLAKWEINALMLDE
jgi:hypothetical protein